MSFECPYESQSDAPPVHTAWTIWAPIITKHANGEATTSKLLETAGIGSNLIFQPATNILEIGSGTGDLSRKLTERRANVFACDLSETISQRSSELGTPNVLVGDGLQLPFSSNAFTYCFAQEVGPLSYDEQIYQEVYRVLKPGGILGFSYMHFDPNTPVQIKAAFGSLFFGSEIPQDPQFLSEIIRNVGYVGVVEKTMPFNLFSQIQGYHEIDGIPAHIQKAIEIMIDSDPSRRDVLLKIGASLPPLLLGGYLKVGIIVARKPSLKRQK